MKFYVSIIAPVFNGEDYIGDFLDGVEALDISNMVVDLVVIDNGSTDATHSILNERNINYYQYDYPSVYSARNFGVSKAMYPILAFIDTDCVPSKDWLIKGVARLKASNIVAGKRLCRTNNYTPLVLLREIENELKLCRDIVNVNAGNFFIYRSDFMDIGGFNEGITTAGDSILSMKARLKDMTVEAAEDVLIFEKPKRLKEWLRFNRREAYGSILKSAGHINGTLDKVNNLLREIRATVSLIWISKNSFMFRFRSVVLFLLLRSHAYFMILWSKLYRSNNLR